MSRVRPVNSAFPPLCTNRSMPQSTLPLRDHLQIRSAPCPWRSSHSVAPSAPTESWRSWGDRGQRDAECSADPQHAQLKDCERGVERPAETCCHVGVGLVPGGVCLAPGHGLGWVPLSLTSDLPVSSIEDDGLKLN